MVDILIVGGGLTGASLVLALANLGYSTTLIETKSFSERVNGDFDARSIALSPASINILQMLKVWPLLKKYATPIETIHVSERGTFGHAKLQGDENNPLGYVVEMQHIHSVLQSLLTSHHLINPAKLTALDHSSGTATIITPQGEQTLKARLIVAADGTESSVRQLCGLKTQLKNYNQHALVANIGLARAHGQRAYERFTSSGPLALLPMAGSRASLVWALPPKEAFYLQNCDDALFLKRLQTTFGYRLGRFVKVGQRTIYPLQQAIMPKDVLGSVVFVGNAAHTLHPVAGQGFNLGLRDIATLAQCITTHGFDSSMLPIYQKVRRHDQTSIIRFTDGLIELFKSRMPGFSLARGMGLMALDNMAVCKNLLAHYARGFAGITPDLVCGIPLRRVHESIV